MKRTTFAVVLAAGLVGLAGCGGSSDPLSSSSDTGTSDGAGDTPIVVGSADFSESVLLAEIYAQALTAAGVKASTKPNIGSREVYLKAMEDGSINVFPEYTGALALYYDPKFDKTDPDEVYAALKSKLPAGMMVLEKSAAEDNDSLAVTVETAKTNELKTIEDLKSKAGTLVLGGPPEFKTRPQGVPGLKATYGLTFKEYKPLKGQVLVNALKNGQVQVANIFSTDPSYAVNNFVALKDTKKLFGSQNVVPLVSDKVSDKVAPTLNKVSAKLTTEELASMLKRVDIDKEDPADVAKTFLDKNDLMG